MTYYVLQKDKALVGKFAHFDGEPDEYDVPLWCSGTKSKKGLPELTLTTNEEYEPNLTDVLLTRIDLEVYSEKMAKALEDAGVKNIDYYPAVVVNHETGESTTTYRTANIIGSIACLDEDNSEVTYSSDDNSILDVEEFNLLEEKIVGTPEMGDTPLMFRLAEDKSIILVHESVKDKLTEAGISGIKFVEPEDYLGI